LKIEDKPVPIISPLMTETAIGPTRAVSPQERSFEIASTDQAPQVGEGSGKVLLRLGCFFGLIVILVFATDALITTGLKRITTSSYGAWNQSMQGKVNAAVIITGSSRAVYHYDPRAIEAATGRTAFNLGRNGSQTDVQLAILKAYLEHNQKPTLVVHNLDAFSFVTSQDVIDPALYVPYLRDPALYPVLRQINPDFVKGRYVPLYGYVVQDMNFTWVLGLRHLLGWSPSQDYFLGFSPQDRQWTSEFENFKSANPGGVNFAVEPRGVQVLEQLIRLCKENGIQLVFVYSPEYTQMQSLEKNRNEIFGEFQQLATRYDVPLWDYSDWKYAGETAYFYNSQHLNQRGAGIFSADLANRLGEYFAVQAKPAGSSEASHPPPAVAAAR
jgi:hypothetical protein